MTGPRHSRVHGPLLCSDAHSCRPLPGAESSFARVSAYRFELLRQLAQSSDCDERPSHPFPFSPWIATGSVA